MDEIQKTLINAGRKDLAQKYYEKIASVNVKRIFENEFEKQIKNRLEKEFMQLQQKLSKDLVPWIEDRLDDYNVQRYLGRVDEKEREEIKKELKKMSMNLLLNAVSLSRLK